MNEHSRSLLQLLPWQWGWWPWHYIHLYTHYSAPLKLYGFYLRSLQSAPLLQVGIQVSNLIDSRAVTSSWALFAPGSQCPAAAAAAALNEPSQALLFSVPQVAKLSSCLDREGFSQTDFFKGELGLLVCSQGRSINVTGFLHGYPKLSALPFVSQMTWVWLPMPKLRAPGIFISRNLSLTAREAAHYVFSF